MKCRAYKEVRVSADTMILVRFTADTMSQALDYNQEDITAALAEKWGEATVSIGKFADDPDEVETFLEFMTEDGDELTVTLTTDHRVKYAYKQENGERRGILA